MPEKEEPEAAFVSNHAVERYYERFGFVDDVRDVLERRFAESIPVGRPEQRYGDTAQTRLHAPAGILFVHKAPARVAEIMTVYPLEHRLDAEGSDVPALNIGHLHVCEACDNLTQGPPCHWCDAPVDDLVSARRYYDLDPDSELTEFDPPNGD